jgi:hypothetical protein
MSSDVEEWGNAIREAAERFDAGLRYKLTGDSNKYRVFWIYVHINQCGERC